MDQENDSEKPADDKWVYWKQAGIFILIGIAIMVANGLVANWCSTGDRGTFGDQFGLSTALFSALAFAGAFVAISMQARELREQKEEFAKANQNHLMQAKLSALTTLIDVSQHRLEELALSRAPSLEKLESHSYRPLDPIRSADVDGVSDVQEAVKALAADKLQTIAFLKRSLGKLYTDDDLLSEALDEIDYIERRSFIESIEALLANVIIARTEEEEIEACRQRIKSILDGESDTLT